jgi:hypothetical protein
MRLKGCVRTVRRNNGLDEQRRSEKRILMSSDFTTPPHGEIGGSHN